MAGGSDLCVFTNNDPGSSTGEHFKRKTASVSAGSATVAVKSMVSNITESGFGGESLS